MADAKQVVCIIDDDPSILIGFKRLMEAYGYDARVFASAREFLAAGLPAVLSAQPMQAGIPGADSCLIIDVAMPEMDGFQLQKELVRAGCKAPIIFITALDIPAVRASAKRTNAAFFFRKPVDADALLDAVRRALTAESKAAIS
ncbi:MAG: response regulator [Lentisphaerae bacterium]|nr:response regulator [Lentisphaerota bacterium]